MSVLNKGFTNEINESVIFDMNCSCWKDTIKELNLLSFILVHYHICAVQFKSLPSLRSYYTIQLKSCETQVCLVWFWLTVTLSASLFKHNYTDDGLYSAGDLLSFDILLIHLVRLLIHILTELLSLITLL